MLNLQVMSKEVDEKRVKLKKNDLTQTADVFFQGLEFQSYEEEDELKLPLCSSLIKKPKNKQKHLLTVEPMTRDIENEISTTTLARSFCFLCI